MRTKSQEPTPQHKAFRDDLIAAMRKHGHLRADELLAMAAYVVGQLIALQDQRKMTPAMAMELVAKNIEAGNQHTLTEVLSAGGPSN
jgi:hypothetical protein